MKRLLLIVALCFVATPALGDEQPDWNKIWNQIAYTGKLPAVEQPAETEQSAKPASREEQRILPPFFAKKYLRGDAWAAWAIEHNERAAEKAERNRRELIVTDSGMMMTLQGGRSTGTVPGTVLIDGGQRRPPRFWRYQQSGGPVTIFNPYCPPRDED